MLAKICDDTWNVLNMQQITPNLKRWHYSDIPSGGHKSLKGPAHMVEGGHQFRKKNSPPLPPTGIVMENNTRNEFHIPENHN